jgi:hypothetical protein
MPQIRLELDQSTFDALVNLAATERRSVPWQAEVLIRGALGNELSDGVAKSGSTVDKGRSFVTRKRR